MITVGRLELRQYLCNDETNPVKSMLQKCAMEQEYRFTQVTLWVQIPAATIVPQVVLGETGPEIDKCHSLWLKVSAKCIYVNFRSMPISNSPL